MNALTILLFMLGLGLLFAGGYGFVEGSAGLALSLRFPKMLMGATIVAFGTTLPETFVSVQAALEGSSGISYGNAIGSIICNTALIAGLSVAVRPGKVDPKSFSLPASFFFAAALIYSVTAWTSGWFARWMGILFLLGFILYMIVIGRHIKKHPKTAEYDVVTAKGRFRPKDLTQQIIYMIIGLTAIVLGSRLLVENGVIMAKAMGVADSVIGLTLVALGTSLPELVTTIIGLAGGHEELSLGNMIGANLLNIVLVSGAAITISPFRVPAEKTIGGVNSSLIVDIPLMLIVMAVLCLPALKAGRLKRWQGIVLLCVYAAFTFFQFKS